MSRFDFATIVLASVSVILAVLALGIGILTFYGYKSISKNAKKAAEKVAKKIAEEIATKVARDTAESVAIRSVAEAKPFETTKDQANKLVESFGDGGQYATR